MSTRTTDQREAQALFEAWRGRREPAKAQSAAWPPQPSQRDPLISELWDRYRIAHVVP